MRFAIKKVSFRPKISKTSHSTRDEIFQKLKLLKIGIFWVWELVSINNWEGYYFKPKNYQSTGTHLSFRIKKKRVFLDNRVFNNEKGALIWPLIWPHKNLYFFVCSFSCQILSSKMNANLSFLKSLECSLWISMYSKF